MGKKNPDPKSFFGFAFCKFPHTFSVVSKFMLPTASRNCFHPRPRPHKG